MCAQQSFGFAACFLEATKHKKMRLQWNGVVEGERTTVSCLRMTQHLVSRPSFRSHAAARLSFLQKAAFKLDSQRQESRTKPASSDGCDQIIPSDSRGHSRKKWTCPIPMGMFWLLMSFHALSFSCSSRQFPFSFVLKPLEQLSRLQKFAKECSIFRQASQRAY